MQTISSFLTIVHVIAGFISLVLFWLPVFTRKGGLAHRKIGRVYVWLMWVVVFTAALLSIKNLLIGRLEAAAFLGFLSFITANPLWYGLAVLRHKKYLSSTFRKKHLVFELMVFAGGVLMLAWGLYLNGQGVAVLMIIFGILGISNILQIIRRLKKPQLKADWLNEHRVGMITTGIAAYTAFFAFGGRQFFDSLLTGYWMILPWVAPTIIGVVFLLLTRNSYQHPSQVRSRS